MLSTSIHSESMSLDRKSLTSSLERELGDIPIQTEKEKREELVNESRDPEYTCPFLCRWKWVLNLTVDTGFYEVSSKNMDLVETEIYPPTLIAPQYSLDGNAPPVKYASRHLVANHQSHDSAFQSRTFWWFIQTTSKEVFWARWKHGYSAGNYISSTHSAD